MEEMDLYEAMAALAKELHQIREEEAALALRRGNIQVAMRKLAKRIASEDEEDEEEDREGEQGSASPGQPRPLGSRDQELLRALRDNPEGGHGHLAEIMYGENTGKNRANIASKFSNLKASGHVIPLGHGKFALTEKGTAAIGG